MPAFAFTPCKPLQLPIAKQPVRLRACSASAIPPPVSPPAVPSPPPSTVPTHRQHPVEDHFRALCADDATLAARDLFLCPVGNSSPPHLPSTWPRVLHALAAAAIVGGALSRLALCVGLPRLLSLPPLRIASLLHYLAYYLNLTYAQRRRILAHLPALLTSDPVHVRASVLALRRIGLLPVHIRTIALRCPHILLLSPPHIRRVAVYFTGPPLSFPSPRLVNLLRRAPWLLFYDIDTRLAPISNWLQEFLPPPPHYKVVLANPRLLSASRSTLAATFSFLCDHAALSQRDAVAVLRAYPPLLTCPVDTTLQPAVTALQSEVPLHRADLAKVIRAFPALLTLDLDRHMRPVLELFRQAGVRNVSRIVKRLPPVLGYDVESNLRPKMHYIIHELQLSIFDVLLFPGLFSYSLERRIRPRTQFLLQRGSTLSQVGLTRAITSTDEQFCKRVAKVSNRTYRQFCRQLLATPVPVPSRASRDDGKGSTKIADVDVYCAIGEAETEEGDSQCAEEGRAWRKRPFRTSLTHVPWSNISQQRLNM